ncbi:MAG: ribbon-helix-helix domain-containing protein [archaeon]|nr:ribbon-helix-helix domain-containing protein [archaeon]
MGKMLTVEVDDAYARGIDKLISSTGLYSSRSEFLKDAIRKNLAEMIGMSDGLRLIHEETEKLAAKVRERGGPIKMTKKQREALARKFMKEKNIS